MNIELIRDTITVTSTVIGTLGIYSLILLLVDWLYNWYKGPFNDWKEEQQEKTRRNKEIKRMEILDALRMRRLEEKEMNDENGKIKRGPGRPRKRTVEIQAKDGSFRCEKYIN